MTDAQKHAARLREMSQNAQSLSSQWAQYSDDAKALLAGAEALEAQGRWRIVQFRGVPYFIPVEQTVAWDSFKMDAEAGEHTEILPEWAVRVPPGAVITGWVR